MAGPSLKGKSIIAIARDIADGFFFLNPIILKGFDEDGLKDLYYNIIKVQSEIRGEKFPNNDVEAIRRRNMRLQRLHNSMFIIKNFARERRIFLY
jgi:hypothetical protein